MLNAAAIDLIGKGGWGRMPQIETKLINQYFFLVQQCLKK